MTATTSNTNTTANYLHRRYLIFNDESEDMPGWVLITLSLLYVTVDGSVLCVSLARADASRARAADCAPPRLHCGQDSTFRTTRSTGADSASRPLAP